MPLTPDPSVGASIFTPRGYIPLPGSEEETKPTPETVVPELKAPDWAPSPLEKALSSFVGVTNPLAGLGTYISTSPTVQAAFRENNSVVSGVARIQDTFGVSNELVDPSYSPWKEVAGTVYEPYWKNTFAYSNNPQYTAALKKSIDRQLEDRKTIEASGWGGTVAGILAGGLDPTLLIPGGGELALTGKGIWTVARGARVTAQAAAVGTTAQEIALQASQETRTPEESLLNVGSSVVLGAVLGGTIAGALSRTQRIASIDGLEAIANQPVPGSVGAAAPARMSLDELTISGGLTNKLAAGTAFSPNLRGHFRESPLARQTYSEVSTSMLRTNGHLAGITPGESIEDHIAVSLGETYGQAMLIHPQLFQEAKKSYGMSANGFDEAIGQAMRRNDIGVNDAVSKAAQKWRSLVVDPLSNQAISLNMLPEDVKVSEAPSYFMRMYNRERMVRREPEFMDIATEHYNGVLHENYDIEAAKLRDAQAEIDNEIASTSDEAAQTIAQMRLQQANLDAELAAIHAEAEQTVENIPETRGQGVQYHGARGEIPQLTEGYYNPDNYYGGFDTFYTTDAMDVAKGYGRKRENAKIYKVTEKSPVNFYDMEVHVPTAEVEKLFEVKPDDFGLVPMAIEEAEKDGSVRLREVMDNIRDFSQEEGVSKDEVQEIFDTAIQNLKDQGYGGMKHFGGLLTGRAQHDVKIYFDAPNQLNLEEVATKQVVRNVTEEMTTRFEKASKKKGKLEKQLAELEKNGNVTPEIQAKINELTGKKQELDREFYDKWEIRRLGEGVSPYDQTVKPDFTSHAKDMARETFDAITGRDYGSSAVDPTFNLAAKSGPLKDRTFHIPDEKIEDFLEDNVVKVMNRFSRTMSAQIAFEKKFPGDNLLEQRFQEIKNEYDILSEHATTEKERAALEKDREGTFRDLRALMEIHRGVYRQKEYASSWGRLVRSVMQFNYLRSMGGSALPSISDLYNPAMFHGLTRYMQVGIPTLLSNTDNLLKAGLLKEGRYAGVAERLGHHRLLTYAEISDPYAYGTAPERLLNNMTQAASTWNGLTLLTDFEKDFASIVIQDHLTQALIKGNDDPFLAVSGMNATTRTLVANQLKKYGQEIDGVWVANTEQWDNFDAVRAYRIAINRNVNADIVTRGVGDIPLWTRSPLGQLITQFKTFNLAAHQRTMLRAMQMGPAQFTSGLIGLTTIGMFVSVLSALRGGKKNWERFKESATNPGYWVGEGLDRTGFFTLPIMLGDMTEKLTAESGFAFNPAKTPLLLAGKAINPDASIQGNTQRFAGTGPWGAVIGPTAGLVEDTVKGPGGLLVDAVSGKPVTEGQRRAAIRIMPYQSYIGMRELLQVATGDSPYVGE